MNALRATLAEAIELCAQADATVAKAEADAAHGRAIETSARCVLAQFSDLDERIADDRTQAAKSAAGLGVMVLGALPEALRQATKLRQTAGEQLAAATLAAAGLARELVAVEANAATAEAAVQRAARAVIVDELEREAAELMQIESDARRRRFALTAAARVFVPSPTGGLAAFDVGLTVRQALRSPNAVDSRTTSQLAAATARWRSYFDRLCLDAAAMLDVQSATLGVAAE
jgi:hypothetical protein